MQFPINMTTIELYWREDSRPQSFWRGLTYAILWPPDVKNWLIWEDPDAGKDWRQEEKGTTEDEMVGWHHQFNGHGFGWTPGVGDGQGGLACCGSWCCKESDTTERLNWTQLNWGQFSQDFLSYLFINLRMKKFSLFFCIFYKSHL